MEQAFKRLNLGFDKRAWLKKHLKKKATCTRCGSVVCRHMMKRHHGTKKCRRGKLKTDADIPDAGAKARNEAEKGSGHHEGDAEGPA